MSNETLNCELFFKKFIEFNYTEDEDKKYQKGLKLISEIDKVKEIKGKEELLFYSYVAEIYYYISKIESQRCKISDGNIYNVEAIQDKKNKQFIEKILEYKIKSFNNYKKAFDENIVKRSTEKMKKNKNK